MTLNGLTQDVLDRIHRFVRLWRCLGWDPYDLDNAIASLQSTIPTGLSQLNDQLLRQLAAVAAAMQSYSLSVASAVALFAPTPTSVTIATRDIPTLPGDDPVDSLYHDLFENLTVLNPADSGLALSGGVFVVPPPPPASGQLAAHAAALAAAFEISQSDLSLAITTFTDGSLTLANLSTLYRNFELAAGLGVTLTELIELLAIAEAPTPAAPLYEVVAPFDGTRPESLATFAGLYATLVASGLSIEQVDYIVRGLDSGTGVAPDPVAVGTLLLTLYNGLVKIKSTNAFAPDPSGALTSKAIAKLLDTADVNTAMAILTGTSTLSDADQDTFISTVLGPYLDSAAATQLVGAAALAPGEARFEYVLQEVLNYEITTLSTGLIVQTLAQALGLETATAELLLTGWLPSLVTPGPKVHLIADFLALPKGTLADTTDPIPPANPAGQPTFFTPYFTSYATLTKVALLITTLSLSVDDVTWWHTKGVSAGWLDPTTLPTTAQPTADGRFYRLNRLITASDMLARVPVTNATFATLFGLPDAPAIATKADYLTQLAGMTQWPLATLTVLCGNGSADPGELSLVYPDDYLSEVALARLIPCQAILSQTGIPADVTSWTAPTQTGNPADPTLDSTTADAIKQSVKANYPEPQWLTLAKQLRDPIRQGQRDALVAFLLAGQPPAGWESSWLDPDDVFAYFLIDVEMCSCMATSRLVQATATVQLFVLRCFLGLEPNVTVDVTADSGWLQWQWMSQYRLWEANREVFLWPENWIDPTLRSDKTPFFAQLQQDLSQGDLTADTSGVAQTALENYLEKPRGGGSPRRVRHLQRRREPAEHPARPRPHPGLATRLLLPPVDQPIRVDGVGEGRSRHRLRPRPAGRLERPPIPLLGSHSRQGRRERPERPQRPNEFDTGSATQ